MLVELGNRISDTLGVGGKKGKTRTGKKKYKLVVRGFAVSTHYTKKAANSAQKKVRGSKVFPIGARTGGRKTTRKGGRR